MDYDTALKIAKSKDAALNADMSYTLCAPRVERVKRKHGSNDAEHQVHRFPLRDGISMVDVIADNLCSQTPLLDMLRKRAKE